MWLYSNIAVFDHRLITIRYTYLGLVFPRASMVNILETYKILLPPVKT